MPLRSAYIIAARRTALGRVGGLHRHRRIEDLTAPVITDALKDAGLSPARVDHVLLGNTTSGGNPARLIALAAGLPESTPALTLDQQCASGFQAILAALRLIALNEAEVVVAGGAEALSMAPWRIAKPRSVHQVPRFIGLGGDDDGSGANLESVEAGEQLARRLNIGREKQDDYSFRSHLAAGLARDARRFLKEIVPLKPVAEEGRDQSAVEPAVEALSGLAPLRAAGTLTLGNTSLLHDGAAIAVVVSPEVWDELRRPSALQLIAHATVGVSPAEEMEAPIIAFRRMLSRTKGSAAAEIDVVELNEASAVQAIAFREAFGLSDGAFNPDGGAIARGNPLGAAGAVLVARLFTRMARIKSSDRARTGAAVLGATGGQGVAALFEGV